MVVPNDQWVSSPLGAAVNRARALNMTGIAPGDARIHVQVVDRGPAYTRHVLNNVGHTHEVACATCSGNAICAKCRLWVTEH